MLKGRVIRFLRQAAINPRKSRKQKEELLLEAIKGNKSSEKSPKKDSKTKTKKNKNEKNVSLDSNPNLDSKPTEKPIKVEEVVVNGDQNSGKPENEELVSEEPNIYELAKEQRVLKKWQKRNQKRVSESEVPSKTEPLVGSEVKTNLDVSDKLTASIVANYEANDHSKTDSMSTANNKKKKDKNKKKQTQLNNTAISDKDVSVVVKEVEVVFNSIDTPNEVVVKTPVEDEFQTVSKKRRARRE